MNKLICIGIVASLIGSGVYAEQKDELSVEVSAAKHAHMPLMVGLIEPSSSLREVSRTLQKDLMWSGQFEVTVREFNSLHDVNEIKNLARDGFYLAIFISGDNAKGFEWRLYDTSMAAMAQGKRYMSQGNVARGWAHGIADAVWPSLTGQESSFSSKIAYCKEVKAANPKIRHKLKHIWLADYDGSNAQPFITTPTVNIAPRWNRDKETPLLFYSENTRSEIRLIVASLDGKRKVATRVDGMTFAPAFSADGKRVVYCSSQGSGYCQLYVHEQGTYKQLTTGAGNALSPSLSDDGQLLYYVSDFPTGIPHIYSKNLATGAQTRITAGEPTFCPSYCSKKAKLAYTKKVNGVMQVFVYDERSGLHRQLTYDAWNKDECSWSPCGNYVVVDVEKNGKERIAMLSLIDGSMRFITPENEVCSYPAWSGIYDQFPAIHA